MIINENVIGIFSGKKCGVSSEEIMWCLWRAAVLNADVSAGLVAFAPEFLMTIYFAFFKTIWMTVDFDQAIKNELHQCFVSKRQGLNFFWSGISLLTERWRKIIQQSGQYIID